MGKRKRKRRERSIMGRKKRINTRKEVPRREMGRSIISCTLFFKTLKNIYIYLATSGLNGSTWNVVP